MHYNFHVANNHYIVEIDDHSYILDTGSPASFKIGDGPDTVIINGKTFNLSGFGEYLGLGQADKLVEEPVDGLLGNDVMGELGTVKLDLDRGNASFGDSAFPNSKAAVEIPFHMVQPYDVARQRNGALGGLLSGLVDMLGGAEAVSGLLSANFGISSGGYMVTNVVLNGKAVSAVLDTGAWISYADADLLKGSPVTGVTTDWQPGNGTIQAVEHEASLELGNILVKAAVSEAPFSVAGQLAVLGAQAVLGFKHIPGKKLLIDYTAGSITYWGSETPPKE